MSDQYDVTPEERQIIEEKAKRRGVLRTEYLKQRTNPFRHALGEGGHVFDPAIQRYTAMTVSEFEYFKPSGRNAIIGLCFLVIPMVGFGYLVDSSRKKIEASYRRGEVAYKDRNFKFA